MAEEIENAIQQNAQGPESAEVDGMRVKQHGLRDQIEADKCLAGKEARRNPARAFARVKIVPPGTVYGMGLGLTAADLKGLAPDTQFELLADRLDKVADPAAKAALSGALRGGS